MPAIYTASIQATATYTLAVERLKAEQHNDFGSHTRRSHAANRKQWSQGPGHTPPNSKQEGGNTQQGNQQGLLQWRRVCQKRWPRGKVGIKAAMHFLQSLCSTYRNIIAVLCVLTKPMIF